MIQREERSFLRKKRNVASLEVGCAGMCECRYGRTVGHVESFEGESEAMMPIREGVVSGARDVVLVTLEEWASRYFSVYICWMDCGF